MNSASSFCSPTASTQAAVTAGQLHPHVLLKEPTTGEPANPGLRPSQVPPTVRIEAKEIHIKASHETNGIVPH